MDKQTIINHFEGDFQTFYSHYLPKLQKAAGDELKAICPFHKDRDPSLSVNRQTGLFRCFGCAAAGSIFDFYAKLNNLATRSDFLKILNGITKDFGIRSGNGNKQAVAPTLIALYDYRDESGQLLYQIIRLAPGYNGEKKPFRIRRPDGNGGWIYNKEDARIIPYRLPEILKATEIIICEGEKDADNVAALGLAATTNPFGAGKWPDHFGPYFAKKHIVLLPDNDDPGRAHMHKVVANLKGHAASIKWLELPDLPDGGDVSGFIGTFSCKEEAAERLAVMIDGTPEYQEATTEPPAVGFMIVNAANWLDSTPPEPDQIFTDTYDVGDKVAIIASSKLRKTFFLLQMLISIATGRPFLSWQIPKPRRILHVQFEIQDHHYHRRVKRMAKAMGITSADLGDRFNILNARGLGIVGPEGIEKIGIIAAEIRPEIISFDPLYKVATGAENAAEDLKGILNCFDELSKKTGAAILYVHHDPKGNSGDRDVRDRGAGSNVLGRDYDAAITLTPHATEADAAVVETLLRNYRPQEPFTVLWVEDESTGGYRFEERPDILPNKKTSKSKEAPPAFDAYLPAALSIMSNQDIALSQFLETFKTKTGLSDHRIRGFMDFATAGGNPYIVTRTDTTAKNKKWLRAGKDFHE